MKLICLTLHVCLLAVACFAAASLPEAANPGEELARMADVSGHYGGHLTIGQRSEPKTLNPVIATDAVSREVIGRLMGDLIEINRSSQQTEPALAKSWRISPDGHTFTLQLRKGIRFSDGHPFDADDVVFSFTVYMDEAVDSPQRDLLIIDGKPILVTKLDQYTVRFALPRPYAAAERLFDGLAMLPKHLLEKPYREGRFAQAWSLNAQAAEIAGLGPFRLKQYVPGQRIVVERNPYYWKVDRENQRLPYLDELVFLFVGTEDAQVMRFEAGETDIISRLSSENYNLLSREKSRVGSQLADMGPSLEYNFLLFNLNDLSGKKLDEVSGKQIWFRDLKFREAISAAVDRDSIVRLVYGARGAALWGNVEQTLDQPNHPASGTIGRNLASASKDSGIFVEPSGPVAGFCAATGRILNHHQFVEQPAYEDGNAAARRPRSLGDAGPRRSARISRPDRPRVSEL
jgi:peptide/nickel transport system substrate-binding protein